MIVFHWFSEGNDRLGTTWRYLGRRPRISRKRQGAKTFIKSFVKCCVSDDFRPREAQGPFSRSRERAPRVRRPIQRLRKQGRCNDAATEKLRKQGRRNDGATEKLGKLGRPGPEGPNFSKTAGCQKPYKILCKMLRQTRFQASGRPGTVFEVSGGSFIS